MHRDAAHQCVSKLGELEGGSGVEMMSPIPFGGWKISPNADLAKTNGDYYWGMGLTAEAVANEFKVSRHDQDEFAYNSHMKALKALEEGVFKDCWMTTAVSTPMPLSTSS